MCWVISRYVESFSAYLKSALDAHIHAAGPHSVKVFSQ